MGHSRVFPGEMSAQALCPLSGWAGFLLLSVSSFHALDSDPCHAEGEGMPLPLCGLSFHSYTDVFSFDEVQFIYFPLYFCCHIKITAKWTVRKIVLFSSKNFMVLPLKFRSLIQ